MLPPPFQNALVLTGPTGSGKTQLGIDLARRLDAEIISMDSMALYRHMDIGTAKPNPRDRALVPHHLIDVLDPWQSASVAWWLEQAKQLSQAIEARGKRVLFVGGTPLYLKALLHGLFDGPPADPDLRRRLEAQAQTHNLHARLREVDAVSADRLHPNDLRRIVRALEVFESTGQPISAWQKQWGKSTLDTVDDIPCCLWLDLPRPLLYDRINRRVEEMFTEGLVEEVRQLQKLEKPLSPEARQALGYKEVAAFLNGQASREAVIQQIQTRTRNFAKRQITWFRSLPSCRAVNSELTRTLWQPKMKK